MIRRLQGMLALLGLAAIMVGLPWLLAAVHYVGAPRYGWSLHGLGQALLSPDDGTLALTLVKVIGWVAWAILTMAIMVELLARLRRSPTPRIHGLRLPQDMARRLVSTAAALFVAGASVTVAAPSLAAPPVAAAPSHTSSVDVATQLNTPQHLRPPSNTAKDHHTDTVRVVKGDTLSQIAFEHTGHASNYPKIFKASKAINQSGGRHLSDPDLILPGWKLRIPGDQHAKSSRPTDQKTTKSTDQKSTDKKTTKSTDKKTTTPVGTPMKIDAAPAPAPTPSGASTTGAPSAAASAKTTPSDTAQTAPAAADGTPGWVLSGLAGAGALLAGSLWVAVKRRRATQFRSRRPGRTMTAPAAQFAPVEKTLIREGSPTGPVVLFLDELLRRLANHFTATDQPMPCLVGVDVTDSALMLRFRAAADLPGVCRCVDGEARQVWRVARDADLDQIGLCDRDGAAPWPQLVTLGADAAGWRLVNLEALGVVSLTGDRTFAEDLARYLVAELAVSPWSRDVEVDCLAVCDELPGLAPARIRFHTDSAPVVGVVAAAVATVDRLSAVDAPSLEHARTTFAAEELWDSRVLVSALEGADHLGVLTGLVSDQAGRSATSVLLVDTDPVVGLELHLDADGRVQIPALELDLVVNGLTSDEAHGCVAVLAAGQDMEPVEIPTVDDPDAQEWTELCDQAGSVRSDLTVPRGSPVAGASSLLPASDQVYLEQTANTAEDLAVMAPLVPAAVRHRVEGADPDLDADVALWFADSGERPRLQVLGPVKVALGRGGDALRAAARVGLCTELVAYLHTRPGGATTGEVADALGLSVSRVRKDMSMVRGWLGINPATGTPFLPEATKSVRAAQRGVGLYLIEDLLCDADLFRRLRLRGETRGHDGMADLALSLRLVTGTPYDGIRTKGGAWLAENRLDQHLLCSIVDVAHMVSTIALERGALAQARAAAELAVLAAPHEATPHLDLAAIAIREGDPAAAAAIARKVVTWSDGSGEAPPDLPERAEAILRTHRWLEQASKAS